MREVRLEARAFSRPKTASCLLLVVVLLGGQPDAARQSAVSEPPPVDQLPSDPLAWLEPVAPLITPAETVVFQQLEQDYQRQAFIDRFWRQRDPFPETGRNEFLEAWQQRLELALERFGNLREDRATTLLLAGPPDREISEPCSQALEPLHIWFYEPGPQLPEAVTLIFVREPAAPHGRWVHWSPTSGPGSLGWNDQSAATASRPRKPAWARKCKGGAEVAAALDSATEWTRLTSEVELVPQPQSGWADEFLARSMRPHSEAAALPASLRVEFPGRHRQQTILQVVVLVPREEATPGWRNDKPVFSFQVDGDVVHEDRLVESFRVWLEVPLDTVEGDTIPLVIERHLRPQAYELRVLVEDRQSRRSFRDARTVQVPALPRPGPAAASEGAPPEPSESKDFELRYAESLAALGSVECSLEIVTPSNELQTGRLRVEANARCESIAKVTFVLNGQPVMSKTSPPYSVEIDLGRAPRLHGLEALALDANGRILARDRVPINAGPHRFAVRLLQPRPGEHFSRTLRAVAEVDLPEGEVLDRVELHLNDELVATLFQAPFAQSLALPHLERITYLRVVAYLPGGNSTEDLVFINAPKSMDRLRIDFVELYASVVERDGSPVDDLERDDFQVLEGGQAQTIRRFERVRDLPIHAGVLLDTSTSMAEELGQAVEGALRFFAGVITPKDRAAVVVFSDLPALAVPFTANHQVLAGGLADLEAEGETALYDSLVYTLHYFSGIRGKRALIVLTDGEDSSSRYSFDESLEFARRSGVAIYSIGLGRSGRQPEARMRLQRLASDTGGRSFFISRASELAAIYETIEEELRFQYLLAYQSTHEDDAYRQVEVRVVRPRLDVKTIPGYYP